MKRICAWCKRPLAEQTTGDTDYLGITHGICSQCQYDLLNIKRYQFHEFLDTFETPILIVNQDGRIQTANDRAQNMLGKSLADIEGYPGGEVFECVNASLPEGCGNTIHCIGCTVRRTVMKTMDNGRSYNHVPASLDTQGGPINFHISTERLGDVVMLRIDDVNAA